MATLSSLLPTPRYTGPVDEEDEDAPSVATSSAVTIASVTRPYGSRRGWKPTRQEEFGGGGAYPECAIAQYPMEMGRKKASSQNTLALQVDAEGNVNYAAIAEQGSRHGKHVQSSHMELVPMHQRTDLSAKNQGMDRPDEDKIAETTRRTQEALEKLTNGKIKAAQPSRVPDSQGATSYIRYTPGQAGAGGNQRIIKMTEVVEDPLEPPRFKHKKIPRGPPSPPPPVLRSPPRKATADEQKEWMIPPCISNWKNNKGYTIPLDKRLAADGRGLQDIHINDNFAKFSEALFVADRHAREEVRQRSLMQQKIAQKEKAAKEESLRLMAQRAREDRSGISALPAKAVEKGIALGGYGSDSDSDAGSDDEKSGSEEEEDDEGAREREKARREKMAQREKEMRMNNMGNEQRAKMLAKEQDRDISEKIALGLAKPSASKETMLDSRLFNRESLSGSFASEDSYNLYDRPLFHGSSAAAAIYKPMSGNAGGDESFGGGSEEGVMKQLANDRFALGVSRGFEGTDGAAEPREGPVQFEKDTEDTIAAVDPFGLDQFLDAAKKGNKRGGLELTKKEQAKRARGDDDE